MRTSGAQKEMSFSHRFHIFEKRVRLFGPKLERLGLEINNGKLN